MESAGALRSSGRRYSLVIFLLIGLMIVTGVTPGHIYYYFFGQAKRMKEKNAERVQLRAECMRQLEEERPGATASGRAGAAKSPADFSIDLNAYQSAAEHHKRTSSIDIELGNQPVSQIGLKRKAAGDRPGRNIWH